MVSLINGKVFNLPTLIEEPIYFLNAVRPRKEFIDGKATNKILGYVYVATNTENYRQIEVFVEQTQPLIAPDKLEELQEEGERIFVEFESAVVKPYYNVRNQRLEDSIKAKSVMQADIE